ncbi:MAG: hypothetical protein AAGL90_03810 [Pseudomonadota bacterium]
MAKANGYAFDVKYYRTQNRDLNDLGMNDLELESHFKNSGYRENRPYAQTTETCEAMSMKWLRGRGLEIGAGKRPTKVFGDAKLEFGEYDREFAFGGARAQHWMDIGGEASDDLRQRFDFSICSHVLEHCDSLLRGIVNALDVVKADGLAYIVLPDKRYLGDKLFIDDFSLEHHLSEYERPLLYADLHDQAYMDYAPVEEYANEHATLASEYREQIRRRCISPEYRFMHHKHNYSFGKWTDIICGLQDHTGYFEIEDCGFGRDRLDCHFILRKSPNHEPCPPIIE